MQLSLLWRSPREVGRFVDSSCRVVSEANLDLFSALIDHHHRRSLSVDSLRLQLNSEHLFSAAFQARRPLRNPSD